MMNKTTPQQELLLVEALDTPCGTHFCTLVHHINWCKDTNTQQQETTTTIKMEVIK
jgi:hypothetical protein